jgi:putative ABC transport system permease protein
MANFKVALFLAYKSIIKGNRWALALIVMVMSLSFVNLVLISSIMAGVSDTMDKQQINNLFANILVDPEPDKYYLENVGETEKKIENIPGVIGISSHLSSEAYIEYQWEEKQSPSDRGKSGSWTVTGIDPEKEVDVTTIYRHITEGRYLAENDRDEIILGVEIAGGERSQTSAYLTLGGVKVGDSVRLTYPNGVQREYTVKGIFQTKEMTAADRQAFVSRREIISVLGRAAFIDRASQILVKTAQNGDEERYIGMLKAAGVDGEIRSWREYGGIGSIVNSFDIIASLVNGIGLIVAAIVMFIVIYINVLHKRRQIGILRAIGIRKNIVITSYLTQALLFAAVGVVVGGLVVGFVIQPYFRNYPLDLPIGMVSLNIQSSTVQEAVLGLIFAGVFAGFIPVLSIIKQSIIKAIWGT